MCNIYLDFLNSQQASMTSFPIDRARVAKKLHFDGVVENSMDAVSDRDYVIEFISACSLVMTHLSRMAEEMVLWRTKEFGFIHISDAYTTGSSIMPQKKNPDMAELVRGKTGRSYGSLVNMLTIMKALPLAYNRDMQEDKLPMFEPVADHRTMPGDRRENARALTVRPAPHGGRTAKRLPDRHGDCRLPGAQGIAVPGCCNDRKDRYILH